MKRHIFLALAILILSSSCSSKRDPANTTELTEGTTINNIVIMPVSHPHSPKDGAREAMLDKGSYDFNDLLGNYFQDQKRIQIISGDQFNSMNIDHKASLINQAYIAGRQLKSDAVLLVTINRYTKRDGDDYSVNHPASVAFEYRLLHPATNSIICSGSFDETQESFTENILSFKSLFSRGFKWINTKQLAKEGLEAKLGECRYLNPAKS